MFYSCHRALVSRVDHGACVCVVMSVTSFHFVSSPGCMSNMALAGLKGTAKSCACVPCLRCLLAQQGTRDRCVELRVGYVSTARYVDKACFQADGMPHDTCSTVIPRWGHSLQRRMRAIVSCWFPRKLLAFCALCPLYLWPSRG